MDVMGNDVLSPRAIVGYVGEDDLSYTCNRPLNSWPNRLLFPLVVFDPSASCGSGGGGILDRSKVGSRTSCFKRILDWSIKRKPVFMITR